MDLLRPLLLILAVTTSLGMGCSNENSTTASRVESDDLYRDDFSSGSVHWNLEGDELGQTKIEAEQLHVLVLSPNTAQYTTLGEPSFSDFILEADASLLDGGEDSTYGVLFRVQESGGFYRFEIMADGRYMLERYDGDNKWTRFIDDWRYSDAIVSGLNANNHIRVEASEAKISIIVNGTLLEEVTDSAYSAGLIGFDAGTFGSAISNASFDNLTVSEP